MDQSKKRKVAIRKLDYLIVVALDAVAIDASHYNPANPLCQVIPAKN